ncbi:MAG: rRNA pseudouridine synthase [Clostridia bacterium]|nr:rRNA pseudouridine synthase [Clostridia bacterium]
MPSERLDKITALNCSVSRRDARKLIKEGRVSVNGQTVLRAETEIDTATDEITVDGVSYAIKEHIYIMMNKPAGVISASEDIKKTTVVDLVPQRLRRRSLFPAGRLDRDTTGLIIITDDGAFTHRLLSPSHHVYKRYIAKLDAPLDAGSVKRLEEGILLEDGTHCLPARVKAYEKDGEPFAQIEIREGKYHQVKRMTAACGSHVTELQRVKIGALSLDEGLAPGECREMTPEELALVFENE